jgi:HPt (histidine-containing phosphotransfer) domain-containing protein
MSISSQPNERLAALAAVLGEADTRELVQLFLGSFPGLLADLGSADRSRAERAAHSLKSSARQMGLAELAERMADLEARLRADGPLMDPVELQALSRDLGEMAKPLEVYVKGSG